MKVSIIITSYNAEETIARTIESCLRQTYTDLDIVIVDDCSTDKSVEIIRSYKDKRIRLICHDCNMGCGGAKRTGLEHRAGEYVFLLDCDDYIEDDFVERNLNAILEYDVDVVVSAYYRGNILNGMPRFNHILMKQERLFAGFYLNTMFAKSSLWDGVKYCTTRRIEDLQSRVMMLYNARRVLVYRYAGYHYTQREGSITGSMSEEGRAIAVAISAVDILNFLEGKEEISEYDRGRLEWQITRSLAYSNTESFKDEMREIQEFWSNYRYEGIDNRIKRVHWLSSRL